MGLFFLQQLLLHLHIQVHLHYLHTFCLARKNGLLAPVLLSNGLGKRWAWL
jgi:hypothetical protein